jgi:hypothetical protein
VVAFFFPTPSGKQLFSESKNPGQLHQQSSFVLKRLENCGLVLHMLGF